MAGRRDQCSSNLGRRARKLGRWLDIITRADNLQAIVTLVGQRVGYAAFARFKNKTSDLVSSAIMTKLISLALLVKFMNFDSREKIAGYTKIEVTLQSTTYYVDSSQNFSLWGNRSYSHQNISRARAGVWAPNLARKLHESLPNEMAATTIFFVVAQLVLLISSALFLPPKKPPKNGFLAFPTTLLRQISTRRGSKLAKSRVAKLVSYFCEK